MLNSWGSYHQNILALRHNVVNISNWQNAPTHILKAWFLSKMVAQNSKLVFSDKKSPICDCSRSKQMPETDQITAIAIGTMVLLLRF